MFAEAHRVPGHCMSWAHPNLAYSKTLGLEKPETGRRSEPQRSAANPREKIPSAGMELTRPQTSLPPPSGARGINFFSFCGHRGSCPKPLLAFETSRNYGRRPCSNLSTRAPLPCLRKQSAGKLEWGFAEHGFVVLDQRLPTIQATRFHLLAHGHPSASYVALHVPHAQCAGSIFVG